MNNLRQFSSLGQRFHFMVFMILAFSFLPALARAQSDAPSSTTTNKTTIPAAPNTDSAAPTDAVMESGLLRQKTVQSWRQQSDETNQKINALSPVASPTIFVPVLFGVSPHDIHPTFGFPRGGGSRTHEGEDIMAIKGTPIVSPTDAVVIRLGVGTNEGVYVNTANPGGETFVYMHLDRIAERLTVGSVLEPGSLIGYVGDTGNALGGPVHLHFEIHDSSGVATDPFPRLARELAPEQKISFLAKILAEVSDVGHLSKFLVLNFRPTFLSAVKNNITLPPAIASAFFSAVPNNPISQNLYLGIRDDGVLSLQKFLNQYGFTVATSGFGSSGHETNYFGPATRAAVVKFQIANAISPAVGYVGSITRTAIARLSNLGNH